MSSSVEKIFGGKIVRWFFRSSKPLLLFFFLFFIINMTASLQATKNTLTLKGSTEIVTEFFGYCINSILYQRGIYPSEDFQKVTKYDLPLMVSKDEGLKKYLRDVLNQLSEWLLKGEVQKLVVVISGVEPKEVLERWVFDILAEKPQDGKKGSDKPIKEISAEIRALIRQITASAWEESDPKFIKNSQEIRMRSFTTKVHKVDTVVSYKMDDDEL